MPPIVRLFIVPDDAAGIRELAHFAEQLIGLDVGQRGIGFVEQEDARVAGDGAGDFGALLHGKRTLAERGATHRAEALMSQKRFDATKIHTHTFGLHELPTALRYAREHIDDAIKVVVTTRNAELGRAAVPADAHSDHR